MSKIFQILLLLLFFFYSSPTWTQEMNSNIDLKLEGVSGKEKLEVWNAWYQKVDKEDPMLWKSKLEEACDDATQVLDTDDAAKWCLEIKLEYASHILKNGFPLTAFSVYDSVKEELETLDENQTNTQYLSLRWIISYAAASYYHYEQKDTAAVFFEQAKTQSEIILDPYLDYLVWKEQGIMLLREREFISAKASINKANNLADQLELAENEKWQLKYLKASVENKLGSYNSSKNLFLLLLDNAEQIDSNLMTKIKLGYGDVMCRSGQTQKAISYLKEVFPEAMARNNIDVIRKYAEVCYDCYRRLGQFNKGKEAYMSYRQMQMNLMSKENELKISLIRNEVENSKEAFSLNALKQTQLTQINQFRLKIVGVISLLLIGLSILGYFLFKNYLGRKLLRTEIERDQEISKNRDQLFSAITQDIRTPLALMMAPLERAMKGMKDPQGIADIQLAHRSGRRLMDLFNQILDWNKTAAKAMAINEQASDLSFTLLSFCDRFNDQAKEKGIVFEADIDIPKKNFILDYDKLDKILSNLVSNANKFCEAGDKVKLSVRWQNNKVEVNIKDNGPGISKEDQTKLFDRHYQGEQGKLKGGTGIGLALVKELVDLIKGTISLESEPGSGTTFFLSIPAAIVSDEAEKTIYTEAEKASNSKTAKKPMILVIEDEPDLLDFLFSALVNEFEIKTAKNTTIGLSIAQSQIPDMILCDWSLPDHDGGWLCRQIKANELTAHIPIMILTGFSSDENLKEVLDSGAIARMNKPFKLDTLDRQVKSILDQQKRLRDRWSRGSYEQEEGLGAEVQLDPFLEKVMLSIQTNMADESFSVEKMAATLFLSRTQLFRKVKNTTGYSPSELLNIKRLEKARQLLKDHDRTIVNIALSVGFSNQQYFGKAYKKHFNRTPKMDR